MLSPRGKMSPFQSAQMYSLQDPNIFNLAVDGVFDDCQDIVKAVSNEFADFEAPKRFDNKTKEVIENISYEEWKL